MFHSSDNCSFLFYEVGKNENLPRLRAKFKARLHDRKIETGPVKKGESVFELSTFIKKPALLVLLFKC